MELSGDARQMNAEGAAQFPERTIESPACPGPSMVRVESYFVADLAKMEKWSAEEKKNFAGIDVGYISQNAYLFCASKGLVTGARASVDRKALGTKLKLR